MTVELSRSDHFLRVLHNVSFVYNLLIIKLITLVKTGTISYMDALDIDER